MRLRASSTTTERPAFDNARAATRPAAPAPTMTASAGELTASRCSSRRAESARQYGGAVLAAPRILRDLAETLRARLQCEHGLLRPKPRRDRAQRYDHRVVDHERVEQKRDQRVDEITHREVRAA